VVPDANVEVVQLETGEVDYAVVQPDAMDELQAAGVNLQTYFGRGYDFIAYNLQRPLFQDVRVRKALTYALDRNQLVEQVLFGQGRLVNSPIPGGSWAFDASLPAYTYNLDTARALLAQAGWTQDADGTLRKGGQAFQFTLDTNSGNKVRAADTVVAQAQFKKLGIDVLPETLELSAFNQKVRTRRDFDAAVYGVTTELDPDQTATWSSSQAANSPNFIGYSNPAVDDLLRQAATVPGCGLPTRTQLYDRFQEILADDQPYTFLYARKTVLAVNKRIDGIAPSGWAGDEAGIQSWLIGSR
jgi:peptide/nickel transport system substrate-binding protein